MSPSPGSCLEGDPNLVRSDTTREPTWPSDVKASKCVIDIPPEHASRGS